MTGSTRNKRSVWTVSTKPYRGAHFATFPPDLIEPCVLAGAPVGGLNRPDGQIRLRSIMDEGKVLLVNLARGKIGEDSAALLGGLLVTSLGLAA